MASAMRTLTLFFISYLVTRGFIPEQLAESLKNDPNFLLAVEAAIATVVTLLAGVLSSLIKQLPLLMAALIERLKGNNGDVV